MVAQRPDILAAGQRDHAGAILQVVVVGHADVRGDQLAAAVVERVPVRVLASG